VLPPDLDEVAYARGYERGFRDAADWAMAKFQQQRAELLRELKQLRGEFAEMKDTYGRLREIRAAQDAKHTPDTPLQ
jgi:hypothetical protein